MTAERATVPYTDPEATDEAVLRFVRRLRRKYPQAYADIICQLPDGVRDALTLAENRADVVRAHAERDAVTRTFVTIWERNEVEEEEDGADA